jgi:type 1 glutamine amidotransferase
MKRSSPLALPGLLVGLFVVGIFSVPTASADDSWVSLFDGSTLEGWRGKEGLWSVQDGALVGSTKPAGRKGNTFLVHEDRFGNFELELDFRLLSGNSGVQVRSQQVRNPADWVIAGYQADIGANYFGSLYEEKRRGMLVTAPGDLVKAKFLKKDDWNRYQIRALGNRITLRLNGLVTADYTETDSSYPRDGLLALQLHGGGPMEVQFKNIRIRKLTLQKLLYVTTAAGFAHSSRLLSRDVIRQLGYDSGAFEATVTDSPEVINAQGLDAYDAVMFYTTGDLEQFPLREDGRNHLIEWVRAGGAFLGVHSATDTYKDWEPYWEMIGGSFDGHPWHEKIKIDIEDPSHPAAQALPAGWEIKDEIYQFKNYSRDRVHVILSMSKESVGGKGKRADEDYAIAWCRDYGKGKVFYTSLGHREDVWTNPQYQAHLLGGIRWTLGQVPGIATPGLSKPSTEFVSLFDGKTLSGWGPNEGKQPGKEFQDSAEWFVDADGAVTAKGTHGHLFSPKEYENFHYRAEVKVGEMGNSGMYFRAARGQKWPAGFEAQVNTSHGDPVRSGSLYHIRKEFRQLAPNDTWFTQEIIANGPHVVIKVNGLITADAWVPEGKPNEGYKRGHFAFQFHDPGCRVWYRNVEVRELPALPE